MEQEVKKHISNAEVAAHLKRLLDEHEPLNRECEICALALRRLGVSS